METDFNIFEGNFYQIPAPNFSYSEIPANCCIRIYEYQQMIVDEEIIIDGEIYIDGDLVLIS
jgi:hypothetical protein